ncbi:MAG: Gfo/Idh/MocA family protein [Candidatus Limnocylindrales bacterium]
MIERRLRSAVIGTGFVAPHHIDAIRRIGLADVVAIVGTDTARTAARARSLEVPLAATDAAIVIADPTIDVIHVCTPNATHVALATAALEAGKHVVVEKPLALDLASARGLVALADRVARLALVAFTYRGYPMVRRARDLVADGELGEPRLIHGGYLQDWLLQPTDWNWRADPAAGGPSRALADIGTHWFDAAEFVAGRRVEAVLADLATFMARRTRPTRIAERPGALRAAPAEPGGGEDVPITSEDAATVLLRFRGGAIGSCIVSQVSAGHRNDVVLNVDGARHSLRWCQESPEELWLGGREAGSRLLVREPAPPAEPTAGLEPGIPDLPAGHPEGWAGAWRDLLRPFYAAIAAGEPPPRPGAPAPYPTLRDGARAVAYVEACLRSAREGRWVTLAE